MIISGLTLSRRFLRHPESKKILYIFVGFMADNYLSFNNFNTTITVPDNAALSVGTGDFSFSFWINGWASMSPFVGTVFQKSHIDPNTSITVGYALFYDSIGRLLSLLTSSADGASNEADISVDLTGWHYIVLTRHGSIVGCYIDAIPAAVTGDANALTLDITSNLLIASGGVWGGSLDDFRIYKSVLNQTQINTIFASGIGKKYSASDAGAASAAWNIDEGVGTTITDEVAGLVGTFSVGGVTWQAGGIPLSFDGGGEGLGVNEYWKW